MAATPADANYRYKQDLKELNEPARVRSIGADELATDQTERHAVWKQQVAVRGNGYWPRRMA